MRVFIKRLNGASGSNVANYLKGEVIYLKDDSGVDSSVFDVDANIGAAWESVGPTGSGATNIWTALDIVPANAKWVELKILNECSDSAGAVLLQYVSARATGSSAGFSPTKISQVSLTAAGSTVTKGSNITTVKIPVDSSIRFDLYAALGGDARDITLYLTGFGV